ncbi:MAG: hypothetical protein ACJ798_00810 [Phenylobacterium sp.]
MRLFTTVALAAISAAAATGAASLAEAKDAPAAAYKAPRTAAGQPDLQGVWTNATITPLERPQALGERLVLTEQEARRAEAGNAARVQGAAQPTKAETKVDDLPSCGGGQTGPACGYNAFWVDPGTKVIRIGAEPRSSIIVSPKDGRLPLSAATQARIRAAQGNARVGNFDGPERRPLGERCLVGFGSTSGPPMLPVLYNNHYQIIQTPGEVMIEVEMVHDTRIVRLNDVHKPAYVRQWMGDSIGHWEGDTLVVETTNFRPDQTFRGATAGQRVTERFTRISPQQILYQFEVADPAALTQPVKGEESLNATNDRVYEYACHEGNYALPGILAGARAEEKKGREMEGTRGEVKEEGAQ